MWSRRRWSKIKCYSTWEWVGGIDRWMVDVTTSSHQQSIAEVTKWVDSVQVFFRLPACKLDMQRKWDNQSHWLDAPCRNGISRISRYPNLDTRESSVKLVCVRFHGSFHSCGRPLLQAIIRTYQAAWGSTCNVQAVRYVHSTICRDPTYVHIMICTCCT